MLLKQTESMPDIEEIVKQSFAKAEHDTRRFVRMRKVEIEYEFALASYESTWKIFRWMLKKPRAPKWMKET